MPDENSYDFIPKPPSQQYSLPVSRDEWEHRKHQDCSIAIRRVFLDLDARQTANALKSRHVSTRTGFGDYMQNIGLLSESFLYGRLFTQFDNDSGLEVCCRSNLEDRILSSSVLAAVPIAEQPDSLPVRQQS